MMNRRYFPAIGLLIVFTSCCRLPSEFEDMRLEEMVSAYARYTNRGCIPNEDALAMISTHGNPAAELMIEQLTSPDPEMSVYDAVKVIYFVQLRGCDLDGENLRPVLESVGSGQPHSTEALIKITLESIENGVATPDTLDEYGPGSCLEALDRETAIAPPPGSPPGS